MWWFCGVVVITSALHAEGREFEPRQNLTFLAKLESQQLLLDLSLPSAYHRNMFLC